MPFFLICCLVLTTFIFDVGDLSGRLTVSLTLLLTAVAFKFVVSSSLPQTEYLTYIDRYFLYGIVFIFLVAVENAVVMLLTTYYPDSALETDRICLYVFAGVWVVTHVVVFSVLFVAPTWLFLPWSSVRTDF